MADSVDDLDSWVKAVGPRALAYARSLLRNDADADEVVQECFCRLIRKRHDYDLPNDGAKLLMASVTNAAINRRTRRKPMLSLAGREDAGEDRDHDPADHREAAATEALQAKETGEAIAEALGRLPVRQRAALELKSLGHSQQEVAEMLGISATNAGVLIHRARETMRELLKEFMDP